MKKEFEEALQKFLDDYLALCEKLHTNQQEKMLLDENSPYNVLKQALTELNQIKGKFDKNKKSDITNLSYNEIKEIHKNDKPIVALDHLHRLSLAPDYVKPNSVEEMFRSFLRDKVEQALLELQAIKNAEPSEALRKLDIIESELWDNDFHYQKYPEELETIEQALLKAEKLEQENKFLKDALNTLIKIDDSDLSHLKIKVIPQNVAVNQDIIKLIKEMMING